MITRTQRQHRRRRALVAQLTRAGLTLPPGPEAFNYSLLRAIRRTCYGFTRAAAIALVLLFAIDSRSAEPHDNLAARVRDLAAQIQAYKPPPPKPPPPEPWTHPRIIPNDVDQPTAADCRQMRPDERRTADWLAYSIYAHTTGHATFQADTAASSDPAALQAFATVLHNRAAHYGRGQYPSQYFGEPSPDQWLICLRAALSMIDEQPEDRHFQPSPDEIPPPPDLESLPTWYSQDQSACYDLAFSIMFRSFKPDSTADHFYLGERPPWYWPDVWRTRSYGQLHTGTCCPLLPRSRSCPPNLAPIYSARKRPLY